MYSKTDELLETALNTQNWNSVREICTWTGDHAPSQQAVGKALQASYTNFKIIRFLCELPTNNRPSQEDVNQFVCMVLDKTTEKNRYSSNYCWEVLGYLCQLKTTNKPNQEVMDAIIVGAAKARLWDLVKIIAALSGDNSPSQQAVGKALQASYTNFKIIRFLCELPTNNRPSQEDVNQFVCMVLDKTTEKNRYSSNYCWEVLGYLCQLKTTNKPNQEVMDAIIVGAAKARLWDLVKAIAGLSSNNSPSQKAVEEVLSHSYFHLDIIKHLCQSTTNKPSESALRETLIKAAEKDFIEIVRYLCELNVVNPPTIERIEQHLYPAFNAAIMHGGLRVIDHLYRLGIDVRKISQEIFTAANGLAQEEVVALLLTSARTAITSRNNSALSFIAYVCESIQCKTITADCIKVALDQSKKADEQNVVTVIYEITEVWGILDPEYLAEIKEYLDLCEIDNIRLRQNAIRHLSYRAEQTTEEETTDNYSLLETSESGTLTDPDSSSEEDSTLFVPDLQTINTYYQNIQAFIEAFYGLSSSRFFRPYHSGTASEFIEKIKTILPQEQNAENLEVIKTCITEFLTTLLSPSPDPVKTTTVGLLYKHNLLSEEHLALFSFSDDNPDYIIRNNTHFQNQDSSEETEKCLIQ